jgi:tetratricopeptide (TPR) repeat protein
MSASVNGSVAGSPPDSASPFDDPRVVRAVQEYLAQAEAGGEPSRSEFVARYPDIAAPLDRCLAGLEFVQAAAPHLSQPLDGITPTDGVGAVTGVLGDFRILREVGRGGMGIVYEAEQVSLGRRVALKVLPLAGMLGPKPLQRFQNEARAAAGLHHTNIVPVHFVGSERGVHFYAMQLIDGQPLSELIRELRQPPTELAPASPVAGEATTPHMPADGLEGNTKPTPRQATLATGGGRGRDYFRKVAELAQQAAEALDYAHQAGIVHRDVKPANLLLDVSGRLWVTDFGLAHVQSEASLTATGDLVGTLRYMSPEQALAKRVPIDHRTDVYSLGATLYELLTLQPAFDGSDRQELLRQIAFEEPRPPRRLNKAIPAELETIVLKAMEKSPAERYATAQELAEDLERFLRDEPIRARRPSLVLRARKWGRRHKPVVFALAAGLLSVLVLAVVVAFWYQRRLAETERGVTAALTQAEVLLREGDEQMDHPERWQATALRALAALEKAEALLAVGAGTEALADRAHQVRAAVDSAVTDSRLLVELDRIRLEQAAVKIKESRFDRARAAPLYAKALAEFGVDLAEPEEAAARVRGSRLREALLSALVDWARVTENKGESQRVTELYQLALPPYSLRTRLTAAIRRRDRDEVLKLTQDQKFHELPPATLVIVAKDAAEANEWAVAEVILRAGLERQPGDFWMNLELGMLLNKQGPPRIDEALRYLTAALALRSDSPGVHLNLGNALRDKGDTEGGIRCFRAALRLEPTYAAAHTALGEALLARGELDQAIAEFREALRINKDDADAHNNLGMLLCDRKGDYDGAIAEFREALRINKDDAYAHDCLGVALLHKGRLDEAIVEHREAIRLKKDYALAHIGLAQALRDKGLLDEAIAEFREAIAEFREALRINKDNALAHYHLGNALRGNGQLDDADAEYREAIRLKKDYPEAHTNLGVVLAAKDRLDEAIAEYRAAIATRQDFPQAYVAHLSLGNALSDKRQLEEAIAAYREAIQINKDCAEAHYNLGNALYRKGRLDEAIAAYREAIRINKDIAEAHCGLGNVLSDKGQKEEAIAEYREAIHLKKDYAEAHYGLGNALRNKDQLDEAIAEYREAIHFKKDFAKAHNNLGLALQQKGAVAAAIDEFRTAVRIDPTYTIAHINLGDALWSNRQLEEAIGEFRIAAKLDPKDQSPHRYLTSLLGEKGDHDGAIQEARLALQIDPSSSNHYILGTSLMRKGLLEEAVAELRTAIRIKDSATARCNLGHALFRQGKFQEAVPEFRRGHELGSKSPGWTYRSADWLRDAERQADLDARLPKILKGEDQPATPGERRDLALLCQMHKKLYAAARWYGEAFALEPALAERLGAQGSRYDAACASALAGCGDGQDAKALDARQRARLRGQALEWLRADLSAWNKLLKNKEAAMAPIVRQQMQNWLTDADFAGVRGADAVAKLPDGERQPWLKLWADVTDLFTKAGGKSPGQEK